MEIKILTSEISNIANSISKYIFKEAKTSKDRQNINWLNEFVNFYNSLKDNDSKRDYTYIEIDGLVRKDLSEVIKNNIFNDLESMNEENPIWLCEMINICNQLNDNDIMDNDKAANSDIGENYDSEFKYKDIVESEKCEKTETKKNKVIKEENTIKVEECIEEEQEYI